MPKKKAQTNFVDESRPMMNPELREQQLIALAENCAERQMREGTASPQVITHYLKLGTAKYQYELVRLQSENELMQAKKENLQSQKRSEELYENAMKAMQSYQPSRETFDDEDL